MPGKMRVLYLSKTSRQGPSSRYRAYLYTELLADFGIEQTIRPLFTGNYFTALAEPNTHKRDFLRAQETITRFVKRAIELRDVAKFDLVVVEHQLFPYLPAWFEERMLKVRRRPTVILEFDDAIYLTVGHREKIVRLAGIVDHVIVGNRNLETWARQFTREVTVIPTALRLDHYTPKTSYALSGPLRIGWIGLPANFGHLRLVQEPLVQLGAKIPYELVVISAGIPGLEGVNVVQVPWSEEREAQELRKLDVGIMPLEDNEWTRGKCGFKILQYMASGVPVVASAVGMNSHIVVEGITGFVAKSSKEWETALAKLARDENLRSTLGQYGLAAVRRDYDIRNWAQIRANLYQRIAARRR